MIGPNLKFLWLILRLGTASVGLRYFCGTDLSNVKRSWLVEYLCQCLKLRNEILFQLANERQKNFKFTIQNSEILELNEPILVRPENGIFGEKYLGRDTS